MRLSSSVAYYSVFSIAPLLIIAVGITGIALGEDSARAEVFRQIEASFGYKAASALDDMMTNMTKNNTGLKATIVGFITLLIGASGVFSALKDSLNTVWEVRVKAGTGTKATILNFVKDRLLNFGMVMVIGFLLLTSLVLSTALSSLNEHLSRYTTLPDLVWLALSSLVTFFITTSLFAFIFKVLPDAKVQWKNVWVGATVTAALFELGKLGLSFYLGRESMSSPYGAAGALVLILLWVYYSCNILLFGAEFTQVYTLSTGGTIAPGKFAELMEPRGRIREGMVASKDTQTALENEEQLK